MPLYPLQGELTVTGSKLIGFGVEVPSRARRLKLFCCRSVRAFPVIETRYFCTKTRAWYSTANTGGNAEKTFTFFVPTFRGRGRCFIISTRSAKYKRSC